MSGVMSGNAWTEIRLFIKVCIYASMMSKFTLCKDVLVCFYMISFRFKKFRVSCNREVCKSRINLKTNRKFPVQTGREDSALCDRPCIFSVYSEPFALKSSACFTVCSRSFYLHFRPFLARSCLENLNSRCYQRRFHDDDGNIKKHWILWTGNLRRGHAIENSNKRRQSMKNRSILSS